MQVGHVMGLWNQFPVGSGVLSCILFVFVGVLGGCGVGWLGACIRAGTMGFLP